MRRSRKNRSTTDSFDLFLDTITNTFGGVLLLALLMVLLIRETGSPIEKPVDVASSLELQETIDVLSSQKQNLEQSIAVRSELSSKFDDPESKALADQIESLIQAEQKLVSDQDAESRKRGDVSAQLEQFQANLNKLKVEMEKKKQELDDVLQKLADEKKLRMRTMQLPKEKETNKTMSVVLIKNNELFIVDQRQGQGLFSINTQHFEKSSLASADMVLMDGSSFKVRKGQGFDIVTSNLAAEFSKFDKNKFITLAVWPDSFEHFKLVREACVRQGFEYQLIPINKGPVVESRSSTRARAQ